MKAFMLFNRITSISFFSITNYNLHTVLVSNLRDCLLNGFNPCIILNAVDMTENTRLCRHCNFLFIGNQG
jgi:hypothetical protein